MISPKSDPPVCKIVDYGKLKYQMDRKKKENLKKTKVGDHHHHYHHQQPQK